MAKSFQRRLRVLVTAAAVGLAVWKFAPAFSGFVELDRTVFEASIRSFANPPYFVSGNGSHEQPWTLRTLRADFSGPRDESPPSIFFSHDQEWMWETYPPSPSDYGVVLQNLNRLGVRHVGISSVMAWDESNPYGFYSIDSQLAKFDSAVTTAPLTRGAEDQPLPLPFFIASIPADSVRGDVAALPRVNRIALKGTFLGSGKTLAGFSVLESEVGLPYLMARWADRIVFSFPVIAAMAESGQTADQIEVRLGSYLKLGPAGPIVPIDATGHLASRVVNFPSKLIPADSLIKAPELESKGSVMLCEVRPIDNTETKRYFETVSDTFVSIRRETGLAAPKVFGRLSVSGEVTLIAVLAALLAVFASTSIFRLRVNFGALAIFILIAQLTALVWGSLWMPLYPSLCAIAAGYLVAWPVRVVAPLMEPSVEPVMTPEISLEPAPLVVVEEPALKVTPTRKPKGVPAKKAAKKVAKKAAKKVAPDELEPVAEKAVKKVAKKATPAKKAAKKTAVTSEKPPAKKAAKKAAKKTPQPPPAE